MYTDLGLAINLVEDPSFENGISKWRSSGQWLTGTLSGPQWLMSTVEFSGQPTTFPVDGKRFLSVSNVAPLSAGPGGIAYDFDIPLPAGTYRISAYIKPMQNGGNGLIGLRAGRSDLAVPGLIGSLLTDNPTGHHEFDHIWNYLTGTFTSDGIHPTSILIRNEHTGSYGSYLVDSVSVLPETSGFQMDLYDQMTPVADMDSANGFALKRYLRAYALMFDQVENYVRVAPDGTPGWARIVNPFTCPAEALDWLSQLGGAKLPFGATTPDKRQLIHDAPGRERGTRIAIIKNVQKYLTGTKYVAFHERTSDNDHFGIGVLKIEAPTSDWFQNLVTNANFESATAPWLTSGGFLIGTSTYSLDFLSPLYGSSAAKVTTTAVGNGIRYQLGVLPAGVYGWTVSLRGALGNEIINMTIGVFSTSSMLSTTWTTFQGVFTADGVTSCDFTVQTQAPTPAVSTFFVDGVGAGFSGIAPTSFVDYSVSPSTIIKASVEEQRSVEFIQDNPIFLNDPWSLWAINSTIIATKVGNDVVYLPTYPTYQDIKRHFTTYDDLKNNAPHTWENLLADYYDPNAEKNVQGWSGAGGNLTTSAPSILQTAGTVLKDSNAGQLITPGTATNQGMAMALATWTAGKAGTYSVNIALRAITTTAAIEVWAGSLSNPVLLFSGTIPTSGWTQVQGQFVSDGVTADYFTVRVPAATSRTINFEMYAMAPGTVVFPITF